MAEAIAHVAANGVAQQRRYDDAVLRADQLQRALDSRVVIEQAKGVLAEHSRITVDTAYRMLREYARNRNLRLPVVARGVVDGVIAGQQVTRRERA